MAADDIKINLFFSLGSFFLATEEKGKRKREKRNVGGADCSAVIANTVAKRGRKKMF